MVDEIDGGERMSATNKALLAKVRRPSRKKSSPANALTKAALRYLDLNGWKVWRSNQIPAQTKDGRYRRFAGLHGVSDIIGFSRADARFLACEIKAGKDRLSQEQCGFRDAVIASGGVWVEARSLDDVIRAVGDQLEGK